MDVFGVMGFSLLRTIARATCLRLISGCSFNSLIWCFFNSRNDLQLVLEGFKEVGFFISRRLSNCEASDFLFDAILHDGDYSHRLPERTERHGVQVFSEACAGFTVVNDNPGNETLARSIFQLAQSPEVRCGYCSRRFDLHAGQGT